MTRSSRARIPLGAIWPLAVVIVIMAAWSAYWYVGNTAAINAFETWQARQLAQGRPFACDARSHGGYPFRFEMTCTNPRFTLGGGSSLAQVQAKEVRTVAQAYSPNHIITEFDGPLYAENANGMVTETDWQTARMSMRVDPLGNAGRPLITKADLEVKSPIINVITAPGNTAVAYRADAFQAHARQGETPDGASGYDLAATSISPSVRLADGREHGAERAEFRGSATHVLPVGNGDWVSRLTQWRDSGGVLTVDALRIVMGTSLAVVDGAVRLDAQGRPEGRVNLTTAGLNLSELPGEDALGLSGIAALSLGALGSPVEIDGRQGSRIGLRLQNGTLFLGPIGLAALPSLLAR